STSFFLILPRPPTSTLFPYTTLFRSHQGKGDGAHQQREPAALEHLHRGGAEEREIHHQQGEHRGGHRGGMPAPQPVGDRRRQHRSEEHTSELQSRENLVCRLLLEKKK